MGCVCCSYRFHYVRQWCMFQWCAVCTSSWQYLHLCNVLTQSPSTIPSAQTAPPTRLSLTGTEKSKHHYIVLHTWPHWRRRCITVHLLILYLGLMVINNIYITSFALPDHQQLFFMARPANGFGKRLGYFRLFLHCLYSKWHRNIFPKTVASGKSEWEVAWQLPTSVN